MTCHSRAGQVFIDAQYQPHSSSVRVRALAAMSPTTPTHLALPPSSTGGKLESSSSFQVTDGGCWVVAMRFHTIRGEGSSVFIYLLVFSILTVLLWPQRSTSPPPPPFPSHCPFSSPHLWCGSSHFLVVTSSAFTLTRDTHDKLGVEVKVMGCESNAPAPTIHTVDMYTKAARHTNTRILFMCVYAISHIHTHTILLATQPCSALRQSGWAANRVMTWM